MRTRRALATRLSMELLEDRSVPAAYFVATSGSDVANGDSAHPWKTIQRAADLVGAGDSVTVRAGTYAGFILGWNFVTTGTAANPITFQADPAASAGSVIINARNSKTPVGVDIEPGCDYIRIQGFTVDGAGFAAVGTKYGIKVTGNSDRVMGNTVKNFTNAIAGIHSNVADNVVIEGNTVFGIGAGGNSNNGHGIYIANGDGIVVRGNTMYSNEFIGLHVNGDPNVVSNALIENNIIHDNGKAGINCDGLTGSTIQNNLIYGYTSYGISLYKIDSSGPSSNNIIVNNTIVSTVSGADGAIRIKNGATGNKVLNNVLLGGSGISITISYSDSLTGLVSNYNVVGSLFKNDDTGSTQSLASWRSTQGQDANSITATTSQLFVDAANANYKLKSTSPAIDVGTTTNAPPKDFEGTPRPSGSGVDIGFDEYSSSVPGTTHFQVSVPSSATAGTSFTVTVSALTSSNSVDTGYTGTVHFTSTDGQAVLPGDYAFVAGDAGVHAFTIALKTSGSRSVTATDAATASIAGSASVNVSAAVASVLQVAAPSNATAGSSFTTTLTAKDAFGNTATGYTGTVHFTSTDGQAVLPSDYAFVAGDAGVHAFTIALKTSGSRSVTATDAATASIAGSASVNVSAGGTPPAIAQRFDFNSSSSPTQSGFTAVLPGAVYSSTAGYGWKNAVNGYDRGLGSAGSPDDLFRDGAWGQDSGVFRVGVAVGASREVRLYYGDPYTTWNGITVKVEGNATPVNVDSVLNRYGYVTQTGSDANADGLLDITIMGGVWVASGLDVAVPNNLPTPASAAATTLPPGGARLDFNGGSNDTIAGFTGVPARQAYTPAVGYGWVGGVNTFERAASPLPGGLTATQYQLYRDGAYGLGTSTFAFAVPVGAPNTFTARAYVGDSYNNWSGITFQMEGNPAIVSTNTTANPFWSYLLSGSDANGDGIVTISVSGPVWVVNGFDIIRSPGGVLPLSAGPAGSP